MLYPLKYISKLDCRFEKYADLDDNCKQELPILHTKDYEKYAKQNDGFNEYTRIYTVLWGSSYKYGWDMGNGGHTWVDFATAEGTPVYSIYDGKVLVAKNMIARWNVVSIEHTYEGKTFISNYAHLSKINVSEGDVVGAWDKIGEVGNTGNSEGNHLHFQIDLVNKFYPYYYDYWACPYSYSKISESDVCFGELEKHTLDPLAFLETQGALLKNIETKTQKADSKSYALSWKNNSNVELNSAVDETIFDTTVYIGNSSTDIKKVQQIFKDLWAYKGEVSGDYSDILDDIVNYQLAKGIISARNDTGAWYFWPKTRAQVKSDYSSYLWGNTAFSDKQEIVVSKLTQTKKIDKLWLISREEIEKREGDSFKSKYKISFTYKDIGTGIAVDQTKNIKLTITDTKGKPFKGTMPLGITFTYDEWLVQVFPSKIKYITDGKRDIKVKVLKAVNVDISAKIGSTLLEKFNFKVFDSGVKIYPETGKLEVATKTILWESKTGAMKFKDNKGTELLNIKFDGTFKISGGEGASICVKKWSISDLKRVYKKVCNDKDFVKEKEFTYKDTIWWILVFDYKILSERGKITITNVYDNKVLAAKSIVTTAPKWMDEKYTYYKEVVSVIKKGIIPTLSKGSFMEDKELTESDALDWIRNTLVFLKKNSQDSTLTKKIDYKITQVEKEEGSKFNTITRKGFLEKTYQYLVFDEPAFKTIEYKDLSSDENLKANSVFDKENTWRDQFGNMYYRPERQITRGEWAYILENAIEKNAEPFVTLK